MQGVLSCHPCIGRYWTEVPTKCACVLQLRLTSRMAPGVYSVFVPPPPTVSCKAWIIMDASHTVLAGHNIHQRLQPASVTKVATALVVLREVEAGRATLGDLVSVSAMAARCKRGTHANLRAGDSFTVEDLLFALMLPSGNDAAIALAEHLGPRFEPSAGREAPYPSGQFYKGGWTPDSAVGRFLAEMSRAGGSSTCFVSPHGMGHEDNLTTAGDAARLTQEAMSFATFRRIVASTSHVGVAKGTRFGNLVDLKKFKWSNTNALLACDPQFVGVKTGWVPNAHGQAIHSCLASRYQCSGHAAAATPYLDVVVLGSVNKPARFVDTRVVVEWALRLPLAAAVATESRDIAKGVRYVFRNK